MSECPYCGDALHSFVEELEDRSIVYLVVCPTCYQTFIINTALVRRLGECETYGFRNVASATPLL